MLKTVITVMIVVFYAATALAGNPTSDAIKEMQFRGKADVFTIILAGASVACAVDMIFFIGSGESGDHHWGIGCEHGVDYMVTIAPDEEGNTTILPCAVLKLAGVSCFEKAEDQ